MKWFKHILWLLAWSIWAFLGYGLYRELPRNSGPTVCRLPMEEPGQHNMGFLGFVAETNEVVFQHVLEKEARYALVLLDAETGVQSRRIPYPLGAQSFLYRDSVRRHGVVFIEAPEEAEDPRRTWGLHAVDLRTGKWQFLTEQHVSELVVHPDRPWVVVREKIPWPKSMEMVAAFDFRTGKQLFATRPTPSQWVSGFLHFLPGTDLLLAPYVSEGGIDDYFEVWSLNGTPKKIKTLNGRIIGQSARAGANGRIATSRYQRPAHLEVFDVDEGRVILSVGDDILMPPGAARRPVISATGNAVFGGLWPTVWPIDGGPPIWTASSYEQPQSVESNEVFMVVETWQELWKHWLPNLKFETRAFRNLDDGRLLFRVYPDHIPYPSHMNAARTLVLMPDGAVRRFPPLVNWTLLILCQSILALPLALLWAAGKWRRRRRMATR